MWPDNILSLKTLSNNIIFYYNILSENIMLFYDMFSDKRWYRGFQMLSNNIMLIENLLS
jgi:hypothetical protein